MKINVMLAKQWRDRQYDVFLYYLNKMNANDNVCLYVASGGDEIDYEESYFRWLTNLTVVHKTVDMDGFNKSMLLNRALSWMRSDWDAFCVFDIDMIYRPDYFRILRKSLGRYDYSVAHGTRLNQGMTREIFERFPDDPVAMYARQRVGREGCSQIAMNRRCYGVFMDCFGLPLYDEKYQGWGAEDSDISFKSTKLAENRMITKTAHTGIWVHLWHENRKPEHYRVSSENSIHFQNKKPEIIRAIETCNIRA